MVDLFKNLFSFIINALGEIYTSITSVVLTMYLGPLLGTSRALFNLVTHLIVKFMAFMSASIMATITLDYSAETSVFDYTFNMSAVSEYIRIFAMALLVLIVVFQYMRIMASPSNQCDDEPVSLAVRTFIAGVLIYASPEILEITRTVFASFLTAVKSGGIWYINPESFAGYASDRISEGIADAVSKGSLVKVAKAQLVSTTSALMLMLLMGAICIQLVSFLLEALERFVVLGVMFYLSPLAAVLFCSKSTKKSAQSWVRMVLSEFFLLVFSFIIIRLFYEAFNRFNTIYREFQAEGLGIISVMIFWCFMQQAILYVGTRFDAYFRSLGISTAQTGGGLAAAMGAELASVAKIGKAVVAPLTVVGGIGSWAAGGLSKAFGRGVVFAEKKTGGTAPTIIRQMGGLSGQKLGGAGVISASQINQIARGGSFANRKQGKTVKDRPQTKIEHGDAYGTNVGRTLSNSLRGISPQIMGRMDLSSALVDAKTGRIFISTPINSNGQRTIMRLTPLNGVSSSVPEKNGRGKLVTLGYGAEKMTYQCEFSGPQAKEFAVHNGVLYNMFKENTDAYQTKDADGHKTGIWRVQERTPDGQLNVTEYSPSSYYAAPPKGRDYRIENYGGIDYYVTSTTWAGPPKEATKEQLHTYTSTRVLDIQGGDLASQGAKVEWVKESFPDLANDDIRDVEVKDGAITMMRGDKAEILYPVAEYDLVKPEAKVAYVKGVNGTDYTLASFSEGNAVAGPLRKTVEVEGDSSMPAVSKPVETGRPDIETQTDDSTIESEAEGVKAEKKESTPSGGSPILRHVLVAPHDKLRDTVIRKAGDGVEGYAEPLSEQVFTYTVPSPSTGQASVKTNRLVGTAKERKKTSRKRKRRD